MQSEDKKHLYFIGIIPPKILAGKIHLIKEEISRKYNCRHALKIPEHITFIPPFRCSQAELLSVEAEIQNLQDFQIPIFLKDFGHFGHNVLFIKAESEPQDLLQNLYIRLKLLFNAHFSFKEHHDLREDFHPHITIANRDLTKSAFHQAWNEFSQKKFRENFTAYELTLFKHDNKLWHPV